MSKREGHDASGFYARFTPPQLDDDDVVATPRPVDEPFQLGDARAMTAVADASVALVVTSPPYFAGKQYEEELGRDGVPASYGDYLGLLQGVFAECVRTLEPGGRIAVNVANLGRRPYRSLAADVIRILQDDLGLLLRGEVVWRKGEGATGSCAWGSYRSPANPVLRDLTERVVIASKGRFDRARSAAVRQREGLPHEPTATVDEFLAATLDVWELPPESARRVGHPAPFSVELPERLIHLYTYRDDLVLDPFMGSGSALVAAVRTGRRYVGYDLDPAYVAIARQRVSEALDAAGEPVLPDGGAAAVVVAERMLERAGFAVVERKRRVRGTGVTVDLVAADADGLRWHVLVVGRFVVGGGGLARTEAAWRCVGQAAVLSSSGVGPVLALTTDLPRSASEADQALRAAGPEALVDVVQLGSAEGLERLRLQAKGGHGGRPAPLPGFWRPRDMGTS